MQRHAYTVTVGRQVGTDTGDADGRQRIGAAVRDVRTAMGLSQRAFAEAVGTNVRSLRLLETGRPGVSRGVWRTIGAWVPWWTEGTLTMVYDGDAEAPPIPAEVIVPMSAVLVDTLDAEVAFLLAARGSRNKFAKVYSEIEHRYPEPIVEQIRERYRQASRLREGSHA